MDSSTLEQIADGSRVFVDSTIFVYHFTGVSKQCRRFLMRCEAGSVKAVTSVVVLAEVAHRLMMVEARKRELVTSSNIVRKLRRRPELVKQLVDYLRQVEKVPLMGIDVIPLQIKVLFNSAKLRSRYGLLTNDSLIASSALEAKIHSLASADQDFARVEKLRLYSPEDINR